MTHRVTHRVTEPSRPESANCALLFELDGSLAVLQIHEIIDAIELGHRFYVEVAGNPAFLEVVRPGCTDPYLRTRADGYGRNNLLALPVASGELVMECCCREFPQQGRRPASRARFLS